MNQETGKTESTTPIAVLVGLTMALLMSTLFNTGCATDTGWRFEVGVSPVKQLSNTAGLAQEGVTAKQGVKY